MLEVAQLPGNQRHWLKVSPSAGAHVKAGAPYTMVIDFLAP